MSSRSSARSSFAGALAVASLAKAACRLPRATIPHALTAAVATAAARAVATATSTARAAAA